MKFQKFLKAKTAYKGEKNRMNNAMEALTQDVKVIQLDFSKSILKLFAIIYWKMSFFFKYKKRKIKIIKNQFDELI